MQSILAIPFAIPLMPEAVGEVDSSTDGAFEATFAAEAPKVPTTDKDTAEAAALGLVMVPNLTAATKPVPVGPRLDPALGKMTATARGQMAGLLPDPGLQNIAVDAAAAFDLPAQVELQALAGVEPQGVASRLGALATDTAGQRGEPSTPDPEPVPPDAILTDGPHHKAIASHAPVLPVALMPEVAGTTETGRSKVAAQSANVALGSPKAAPYPGEMVSVPDASSPTAGKTALANEVAVRTEPGASAAATTDRDQDVQQTFTLNLGEPLPKANASDFPVAEAHGHPDLSVKASQPHSEPVSPPAAIDPRSVRQPVPPTPEIADGGSVANQGAAGRQSGDGSLADAAVRLETPIASTGVGQALPVPEAKASAFPDAQLPDLKPELAEIPDRMPAPSFPPSGTPAGFWERLFTGLTVTEPGNQVLPGTALATGNDAGPRSEVRPDHAADLLTPTLPIPPATGDRPASGLTIFARGQALHAGPAEQPAPNGEETELTAFSLPLLHGTPGQSMPQPAASASGPTQLPVPQVAAQITAALSQTADGATELALSPEELGNVRLRLERDSKNPERMVVHITFERPETLDLFRRHAGELTDALRDAGYAGADIGFGHEGGRADTSERDPGFVAPDYCSGATGATDPQIADPSAPRLLAGASLDLRL
jgi:Flagellar hook-length control protein FliK